MRHTNDAANNCRDVGRIEIVPWDIVGKVTGQLLYKLWGAQKNKVPAHTCISNYLRPENAPIADSEGFIATPSGPRLGVEIDRDLIIAD